MSSGTASMESLPSTHLLVKLPPDSASLSHAGHHFFMLLFSRSMGAIFMRRPFCLDPEPFTRYHESVAKKAFLCAHITEEYGTCLWCFTLQLHTDHTSWHFCQQQKDSEEQELPADGYRDYFNFYMTQLVESKLHHLIVYLICSFSDVHLIDYIAWKLLHGL